MERKPESPRYFTLEEANGLLPRVREILLRLQVVSTEFAACRTAIQQSGHAPPPRRSGSNVPDRGATPYRNGAGQALYTTLGRMNTLMGELRQLTGELESIGCEVKDLQTGLVDFRAMRDGRAVYLCWRLGEDQIRFWHELDNGFAGRQPL